MKQTVIFSLIVLFSICTLVPPNDYSIFLGNYEIPIGEESDIEKKFEVITNQVQLKKLENEIAFYSNLYGIKNKVLSNSLSFFVRSAFIPLFIFYESFLL